MYYVISKGPVQQFPGFFVCLVNTVVTFSIYKNAHPSNFKRPMGRGIDRESHMLEYISTHAHCAFFSHKKTVKRYRAIMALLFINQSGAGDIAFLTNTSLVLKRKPFT